MKKVFKYRKKLRLEQGRSLVFKIHKKVVGPDGDDYFVMVDPFGDKHLVPVEYYSLYNLEVGKSYLCKVDKINCLGRIFIEPPHPFYKENKSYLFEFSKMFTEKHKSGYVYSYYLFRDKNKYKAFLNAEHFKLAPGLQSGFHSFRVKKISKGRVCIDYR